MLQIIVLGLAAAVFPLLLACVAILISRPKPRRLMLGFYLGGLTVSVTCGIVVISRFNDGASVLGSTNSSPSPGVSILFGTLGLAAAWLMVSSRGQARIERVNARRAKPAPDPGPSRAERALNRANVPIAVAVGAVINLPGPFYVLALGDIAEGGYTTAQQVALILIFNAAMFILLEVPLISYLIAPEATEKRVAEFSHWLRANGLRVMGALFGVASIGVLIQGLIAAAG